MVKKLGYLVILALGVGLGIAIEWIHSYHEIQGISDKSRIFEKVIAQASVEIPEENYACEGKPVNTVGAVVASMIELNSRRSKNMLSYGCYKGTCTMSHTDCKPWQRSECSSRFLTFQIDEAGDINTNSFSCFDMP